MTSRLAATLSRHGYITAVVAIALSTALFLSGRGSFAATQWALLYLLIIMLIASVAGPGPAVLSALLAFFAWNFFFLPPFHTFAIHDPMDLISLVAFLVVGVLVGVMGGRMRDREASAIARQQETAALNRLSEAVVTQMTTEEMAESCVKETVGVLDAASASLFILEGASLRLAAQAPAEATLDPSLEARAAGILRSADTPDAGAQTTLQTPRVDTPAGPQAPAVTDGDGGLYVPVPSPSGVVGVLVVRARSGDHHYSQSEMRLVTSLGNLVGAFLERERLQAEATAAAAAQEADQLKSSLLSSVSHELKTPLAALTATVSNLLESDVDWDEESVKDELRAIVGDVARLNNSIGALLDLSRLEAHAWAPRRELYELSDLVAAGIDLLPTPFRQRVVLDLPEVTPVVDVDFVQWTRVIQSLLENALLYAGEGPVTIGAHAWNEGVRFWVEDQGPGVPSDEHEAVFEKFYRGRGTGGHAPSGTGLGLAIAREIVRSHGGVIRVEDVVPHGARFVITLPAGASPDPARSSAPEEVT